MSYKNSITFIVQIASSLFSLLSPRVYEVLDYLFLFSLFLFFLIYMFKFGFLIYIYIAFKLIHSLMQPAK